MPPKAPAKAYAINVDGFSDPLFKTHVATMMAILTAFEPQLRTGLESVVRKAIEAANSSSNSSGSEMRDEHVARHSQAQILLGDNHSMVLTALSLATAPPLSVGTMSLRLSSGKRPEYPTPPLTAAQASYTLISAGIASLSTDFNPLGKPLPTLTSLPPLDKASTKGSMAVLAVEAFAASSDLPAQTPAPPLPTHL
ncbi:hypothetical protein V8C86DRAFT_3095240 [Haematococcus lacustris]